MIDKQDTDQVEPARSPALVSRDESALLIVDMQPKLLAAIAEHQRIRGNASRLKRGASALDVAVHFTEQYPERLGGTDEQLLSEKDSPIAKRMFSCRECVELFARWREARIRQIVICGIETHVCVLQSSLDLLAEGFEVFVVADATGSRFETDYRIACQRLQSAGATLVTTESVLFEWCETSTADEFKQISSLVTEKMVTEKLVTEKPA